ncbi:hypothetical protein [Streptomyces botrytidirepellens]|uniref:hypothetical protein n=1 Tax=Streptomyces botrytidirepellens TaxID=2486417 RepID=UPI00160FAFA2|nr:hypothetical protein [Streptomyces botrytidirepellens]
MTALAASLAECCRQHELALSELFTEHGPIDEVRSPTFLGLLDILALPHAYGVVLAHA